MARRRGGATYQEVAPPRHGALDHAGARRAVDAVEFGFWTVVALATGDVELVGCPADALASGVVSQLLSNSVIRRRLGQHCLRVVGAESQAKRSS